MAAASGPCGCREQQLSSCAAPSCSRLQFRPLELLPLNCTAAAKPRPCGEGEEQGRGKCERKELGEEGGEGGGRGGGMYSKNKRSRPAQDLQSYRDRLGHPAGHCAAAAAAFASYFRDDFSFAERMASFCVDVSSPLAPERLVIFFVAVKGVAHTAHGQPPWPQPPPPSFGEASKASLHGARPTEQPRQVSRRAPGPGERWAGVIWGRLVLQEQPLESCIL